MSAEESIPSLDGGSTSWDITKLRGPVKWTYFYLYVILDIFSRYVTGWMLARRESAELARRLISESCLKQNIEADQLTIHADRGSSMRSKSVALLVRSKYSCGFSTGRDESANKRRNHAGMVPADRRLIKFGAHG